MKIGLARRGYSPTGGAESYLRRFVTALREAGLEAVLFGSPEWPVVARLEGVKFVSVAGRSPRAFSEALGALRPRESGRCDVLFSLERVAHCDCFRAGDGVHRVWLEHRAQLDRSPWQKLGGWTRAWNPKHRQILALENALFAPNGSGTRGVIANSQMVANEISEIFRYPAERIRVIPNGLPAAVFARVPDAAERAAWRRKLELGDADCAVLFAGSGWERKGLRFAVEAVSRLDPKKSRCVLLVAGSGKRQALPAAANDARRVRFLGPVPSSEMPALYAAADVFLLPTLYDPFSNACLEAAAAGLPVITTAQNGFAEILVPGVTGGIAPSATDISALTESLAHWADPERRAAARAQILETASRYTIEANLAATLDFLTRLPPPP